MITTCLDISTLKEGYVQHNNVELLISIAHHYDSTNESIGSLLSPLIGTWELPPLEIGANRTKHVNILTLSH